MSQPPSRFLERTAIVTIVLLLAVIAYCTHVVQRAHRDIDGLIRLVAELHPMQDFLLLQHGSDWFAIVRQDGEGDDSFAARAAGITSGEIDPMQTHLCATVSGCSEGRSVTVCIAILPGFTQAENEAKLASLKAAVCAALNCTTGCS